MTDLALTGLTTRPAQVWGGVRLVPLVREEPIEDLRLDARLYDAESGVVEVDPRTEYLSYTPHGFVASWTRDGTSAAAYGTQLRGPAERDRTPSRMPLRFHRRMARRADRNRLRFLPPFERRRENHIGELVTDGAGRLAYLKTFRLSENQVRRGHLLTRLAAAGWNLADAAVALGVTEAQLGLRIEAAGFGHLLRQDVLDHYRAQVRRAGR
ncbi:hypothetical protein [Streptosporangium sp. NPDC049644]|uniref:ARPP-2 domain-containing protein n=1 Tax=Streptosporangium sp. NPDC049644 TaxID=3155507 RepID=UPI00344921EC